MKPRPVPRLNKPEFRIIFYHHVTGDILKYKFMSEQSAHDFFDRLDKRISKPVMCRSERIR